MCLLGARTSFPGKVVSLEVVSLQPEIFLTLFLLQLDVVSLQNVFNSFCLDPGPDPEFNCTKVRILKWFEKFCPPQKKYFQYIKETQSNEKKIQTF